MNAGRPGRAMEIAEEVLASPDADDTAIGWSAAAAALSSARMGRFADVDALAERAMEAQHPGLLRFTSGFGQTTALVMAGELDRAQELAQQLTDFAQMQQPGRAIGEVLVADVLIARGELGRCGEAVARRGGSAGADRVFVGAAGVDAAGAGARPAGRDGRGVKDLVPRGLSARAEVDAVRPRAVAGAGVDDGGAA